VKSWLAVAFVVGCASPSPADDLADLTNRATSCGEITNKCGYLHMDASVVAACLNQDLAAGTLAYGGWSDYDAKMYTYEIDVFVDGGKLRVFDTEPDDFGGPSTVTEKSCAGPVTVSTQTVCYAMPVLDVCP